MNSHQPASTPKRLGKIWWVFLFSLTIFLIGIAFVSFRHSEQHNFAKLPKLFKLPQFQLTNQDGKKVTEQDLKGKIWIIDFIFTRCPGPCPMITAHMQGLASKLNKATHVQLLSVTVDPQFDTPTVLKQYAAHTGIPAKKWMFLTGTPKEINSFVSKGMKQALVPGSSDNDLPTHSTRLMIIDSHGIIRSIQDSNDPELDQKILVDIGSLLQEEGSLKK